MTDQPAFPEQGMTFTQHVIPGLTDDEADGVLWNRTPFPLVQGRDDLMPYLEAERERREPVTTPVGMCKFAPDAITPRYAHPGDAGLDLHYYGRLVELDPGRHATFDTGIAVVLPDGYCGWVVSRSGLAARHGIAVLNAPGLIDSSYRGPIQVILHNHGPASVRIMAGDRIAQLVIQPVVRAELLEIAGLPTTTRGVGGLGSTGQ